MYPDIAERLHFPSLTSECVCDLSYDVARNVRSTLIGLDNAVHQL